jgi:transcriptional regulator with XRE-family HTH domain
MGTTVPENFHDRLWSVYFARCQRERRKITQAELAKGVEGYIQKIRPKERIADSTVSRWFAGSVPGPDYIAALAKVLGEGMPDGVDPGWLLFGADSAAPAPSFGGTPMMANLQLLATPPNKKKKKRGA